MNVIYSRSLSMPRPELLLDLLPDGLFHGGADAFSPLSRVRVPSHISLRTLQRPP